MRRWDVAVQLARALPEEVLHERVDGEWSFIETLRHLVFATDAWVLRAILGDPAPYHPLGLAHSEMPADTPAVPHDPDARPSLDEILAVRSDRMATVARVLHELTDERLDEMTEPVLDPGYPGVRVIPGAPLPRHGGERGMAAPRVRRARPRRPYVAVGKTSPGSYRPPLVRPSTAAMLQVRRRQHERPSRPLLVAP